MQDTKSLPPKSEWNQLTLSQLFDVKSQMHDLYFNMRSSGATFANQYLRLINELDALIARKQMEAERDRNSEND